MQVEKGLVSRFLHEGLQLSFNYMYIVFIFTALSIISVAFSKDSKEKEPVNLDKKAVGLQIFLTKSNCVYLVWVEATSGIRSL